MAPTLQDATNALQQGNKQLATGTLASVVRSEPNNEMAWLMLASLLDDNDKKRHCLERVLAINPGNGQATLEWMRLQQAPVTSRPVPPAVPDRPSVESVQCPKCGAAVDVTLGRQSLNCTYCGAGLRIVQGSSGRPIATLDDIKVDTSFLAAQAALRRMGEKLQELQAMWDQLSVSRNESQAGMTKLRAADAGNTELKLIAGTTAILAGAALSYAGASDKSICLLLFVGLAVVVFGIVRLAQMLAERSDIAKRVRAAETAYLTTASRIDDTSREIDTIGKQRDSLAARLDNLGSQL